MSGIAGIWNRERQPVPHPQLAGLIKRLAHRGPDSEEIWVQGPVGFACRLNRIAPEAGTETQPVVHRSGLVLVFDGRLDNRDELLTRLHRSPDISSGCSDPSLVLAAYVEFGDRFAELLVGDFALGLFDASKQRLVLVRDAMGVRPLYYTHTREAVLFASEIKALLAHPQVDPRPNNDFLANLLVGNVQDIDGATCFQGIPSVPPAHIVVVTPQGTATRRYWDFNMTRRTELGSFPEYAEAFRFHFEQAIRRRLRSVHPVAVAVSGGVDSSSIFCQAEFMGRRSPGAWPPLVGLSYTSPPGSPSDESAFLIDIEREYDVAIERVKSDPGLRPGERDQVWHVEAPLLDGQWNVTHQFMQAAHHRGARLLLTGHWGDQMLFSSGYLIDLFFRFEWTTIRHHLRQYGRWMTDITAGTIRRHFLSNLMKYHAPDPLVALWRKVRAQRRCPWYSADLLSRVGTQASHEATRCVGSASVHAQSLYAEARSAHHVQCLEWNNKVSATYGLEVAFPFLDRDLVAFLMSVPGERQTYQGIPKALLREAMQGILPDSIRQRTWKADFTQLVHEGMKREVPHLLHRLCQDGAAITMGYLKKEVLSGELTRLERQIHCTSSRVAQPLLNLIALELWLEMFFPPTPGGKRILQTARM